MKNIILTFFFALGSFISFTQADPMYTVTGYCDTTYISSNEDTIHLEINSTETITTTVDWTHAMSTVGYSNVGSNFIVVTYDVTDNDTLYFRFYDGSSVHKWVRVIFVQSLSTSENTLTQEELKVCPSPAKSVIKISFSADKSDMPLKIFSLNGQLIYQDTQSREVGSITTLELNVSDWENGQYLIKTETEVLKFIVE